MLSNPEKQNVSKSKEEKYRDVMVVCKSLTDLVSTLGSWIERIHRKIRCIESALQYVVQRSEGGAGRHNGR